ncbi:NPP1 family protein [Sinorhizobium meliloti]|uniref:NPP1 family protein n=1 Tax=Rhizobium meliloti TaxID=382 RepID=UPI002D799F52|nr:NPP1 family protein [Sinorhizobium meliloti]
MINDLSRAPALKPSGMWPHDGCSRHLGQISARAREYEGECGVMYSWFFSREQIPDWPPQKWVLV